MALELRKRSIRSLTASAAIVNPSPAASNLDSPSSEISTSSISINSPSVVDSSLPRTSTPSTSKTSQRIKSHATRWQALTSTHGPARDASVGQPPATAPSVTAQSPFPKQLASLRVEIVSVIAEETLAVYSGQDVLISTRLDSAHLGELLHFDCPLSPGAHPLRVALYRGDETLHIQKEGFAEILSDGSNTLDIRVNRRSKLLIRREATLEVRWPNPHSAAVQYISPLAAVSTSSK